MIARATVWSALDRLQPRRRAVLVMHELDDVPVPKIAATLGISAITVRWHLAAGRRELARAVKPFRGENHEKH
jgi:RNA polymerase sigma-70 factor (ECF subfamily)